MVIPVFNEEDNVEVLANDIASFLSQYRQYEILFVDDGSGDDTLKIITEMNAKDRRVKFLSFTRNFGHQTALRAGYDYCRGDCVITMDGDLQHPPSLIPKMVKKWQEGYKVVDTERMKSEDVGFLKTKTAYLFYKIMNMVSDVHLHHGAADFRLLDRSTVNLVRHFSESPFFLRGIVPWLGFKCYTIKYVPSARLSGKSKYSFLRMLTFALNGITSFSVRPLHLSTVLGCIISLLAFVYAFYAIFMKLFSGATVSGWTSVLTSVLLLGGIQLIMLGILGDYLGKLFIQSKGRPPYVLKACSYEKE